MVISRDETLAGLRSSSPAQPNVTVMIGFGAVWGSLCERKQREGGNLGAVAVLTQLPLFC